MKFNYSDALPAIWSGLSILLLSACVTPATHMRHAGEFSNIRSEVFLADGSSFLAYTSYDKNVSKESLTVQLPGEKNERSIPLAHVEKLKMEDHEFVVRWITTPQASQREGKPAHKRTIMKRMGMESDIVQVFEYKYELRNPKSPIPTTHTTWYVAFPGEDSRKPLTELGSADYRKKWNFLVKDAGFIAVSAKPPHNVKLLLDEVKKIPAEDIPITENLSAG